MIVLGLAGAGCAAPGGPGPGRAATTATTATTMTSTARAPGEAPAGTEPDGQPRWAWDFSSSPLAQAGLRHDPTRILTQRAAAWHDRNECALSCHTTHPFAMVAEHLGPAADGTHAAIVDSVAARTRAWPPAPWYGSSETKTAQSHGSEAVLNAVALRAAEAPLARAALDNLFATQQRDGGWAWLDFSLAPWEDGTARTAGAALAAIAIAEGPPPAPDQAARWRTGTEALRGLLAARVRDAQLGHDQLMLLWATGAMPGIASATDTQRLVADILTLQRADGGWSLPALGRWRRASGRTNRARRSDAYATALAAFVLARPGRGDEASAAAARARTWLVAHQRKDGSWAGVSLNDGDAFNAGLASDHATALAVLALATPKPNAAP